MEKKRFFIGLVLGWMLVLFLSVLSVFYGNNVSGAVVKQIKPLSQSVSIVLVTTLLVVVLLNGILIRSYFKKQA
ncbi:hypothetical protein D6745_01520 [Candidatus Woesearchaeota archaeon]|nr:MAG: hypothetical protein D6745_01520 [Candidatus Woesearchaeota archaeon]